MHHLVSPLGNKGDKNEEYRCPFFSYVFHIFRGCISVVNLWDVDKIPIILANGITLILVIITLTLKIKYG